jgi:hypothetical protein
MLAAPQTPQTLDFIDYRGVCPQSYRVTGTWERVMGMLAGKIFAPAFRAPPPRPSARPARRDIGRHPEKNLQRSNWMQNSDGEMTKSALG